jgi:hypothetical protein
MSQKTSQKKVGLSEISKEEIIAEIKAVRNAKNNS